MARVRFFKDFDYRPTGNSLTAYIAGMEETVKRECADQAIAEGKAVELPAATRGKPNGENPEPGTTGQEA